MAISTLGSLGDLLPVPWLEAGAPPLEIDVGCHKGLFLIDMALRFPERNFLGIELQAERVEKTRRKIRRRGLVNAVVAQAEGLAALEGLPRECAAYIHVLFPDPWPKRRHNVRRLVQGRFLEAAHRVLETEGILRLVTDDRDYAVAMEKAVENCSGLARSESESRIYPPTEFQKKFSGEAHAMHVLELEKVVSGTSLS